MKLKSIAIALFCIAGLFACQNGKEVVLTDGMNQFGEVISADNAMSIEEALDQYPLDEPQEVKLTGTIGSVCQAKGCWMTLSGEDSEEDIFIKFKDYAFFVPKNAGGQRAVVSGLLSLEETSVDELRHYAEDEGKSEEEIAAITAPKKEWKMMASGVLIYN